MEKITLDKARSKGSYRFVGFSDPQSSYASELAQMGFVEGALISLARINRKDPMIVNIRHGRVSLRPREARVILVREA